MNYFIEVSEEEVFVVEKKRRRRSRERERERKQQIFAKFEENQNINVFDQKYKCCLKNAGKKFFSCIKSVSSCIGQC